MEATNGVIGTRIPNERETQMIALYKSGKTMHEIGLELGISRQRVCQILQRNKVETAGARRGRKPMPMEQVDRYVAEAVRLGSKAKAAASLGVSADAISRALKRKGIKIVRSQFEDEKIRRDIRERYLAGERLRLIAESYGTRAQHINSLLRKWGVQPKRRVQRVSLPISQG